MKKILLFSALALALAAQANESKFHLDYLTFDDDIYSQGRKTELGDEVELEAAFKYQYDQNTFARFRFETRPEENRYANKTSKFELLLGHQYEELQVGLDLELKTDDGTSGGTSLGLDTDSEYTFLAWNLGPKFRFSFFPYNFDGEVGEEFYTWDVTRLNFISGSPTTVAGTQSGSEKITQKTIPGVELRMFPTEKSYVYAGAGIATYEYPTNSNFDLVNNPSATRWERKEDIGFKFGAGYEGENLRARVEYVTHTEAKETGALLESAGSLYIIGRVKSFILESELTYSKAGSAPWNIEGTWFKETTPFQPIYADYYGKTQDWVGKSDFGLSLRLGYEFEKSTPYLLFRYQGKNFVFIEEESAHMLRTYNDSNSHGGLTRTGFGTVLRYGNFAINPEFEFRSAKNPVFGNSSDLRSNRVLSSFKKTDYLVSLFISYEFGGNNEFRP